MTGDIDSGRNAIERRWDRYFRSGPFLLLGIGVLISAATRDQLMTGGEQYAAGALTLVTVALQAWWWRVMPRTPLPSAASAAYYVLRTVLSGVLTWLNPFFAVYAVIGYFDSYRMLSHHPARAGLLVTAFTLAGSQSGGLPPGNGAGWATFGGLLTLNGGLSLVFAHIGAQEADHAKASEATILELERTNARLEQALEENAGLHAQLLVQAREAGVGDERRRLAAEIHDTIAQGLAGIITQLQAAADSTDPDKARNHVRLASALARHSLGEARRSVQNLGPAALEHDSLPEALRKIVQEWGGSTGVRADFTVTGTAEPLHEEIEGTVVRIAQEALANAAQHSGAARVGVTLSFMGDEVSLDVRDDGRGFDPLMAAPAEGTRGFGLGGMRARAERIAGTLSIESEPGGGTAVSARVPLLRHA